MHRDRGRITHHLPRFVADAHAVRRRIARGQAVKRQFLRVGSLDRLAVFRPLILKRLGTAGHHRQGLRLAKQLGRPFRLPKNHHRLHNRQLDFLAHHASGRVFHHDLIAAFVRLARVGHGQYRASDSRYHLAVEAPLILDRLAAGNLNSEFGRLAGYSAGRRWLGYPCERRVHVHLGCFTGHGTGLVLRSGVVAAGVGDLYRLDHQCLGDFAFQCNVVLEPLILDDGRTACADAKLERIANHQLTRPRLGGDLDRQDQGELGLLACHGAGRVFHDDLIAALGDRLHVGEGQGRPGFTGHGLVIEPPLISQRRAAGGLNGEHRGRPLNPPRGIRLLHDGDGIVNRDKRLLTHDFAAFIRDGDVVHPGVGQLHVGDLQFRDVCPLYFGVVLEPLIDERLGAAGRYFQCQLLDPDLHHTFRLGENLDGLNHGQPRLVADHTPGRVVDHDLVTALVLAADIGHRQPGRCGARDGAVVEQPLVRQWLAARRLHLEQGRFPADRPCRLRLLADDDRLIDHHLRLPAGGLAGGVPDHHAVDAGIVRDRAVDLQERLVAHQQLFAILLPMIRKRLTAPRGYAKDELVPLVPGVRRGLGQNDRR